MNTRDPLSHVPQNMYHIQNIQVMARIYIGVHFIQCIDNIDVTNPWFIQFTKYWTQFIIYLAQRAHKCNDCNDMIYSNIVILD